MSPRLKRALVVPLVGVGSLLLLGHSPPATIKRTVKARSGVIDIQLQLENKVDACETNATLSIPVRRATLFKNGELVHDSTCLDNEDCLSAVHLTHGSANDACPFDHSASAADAGPIGGGGALGRAALYGFAVARPAPAAFA
jgi:hypothetical protein